MNMKKTGILLKELRKENGMTQEQLAEKLNVAGRTVSRWETGNNLPDLDVLVEIADLYNVDIREIIDGERKGEKMTSDEKDTLLKVADYSNEMKKNIMRNMHLLFIGGTVAAVIYLILLFTDNADNFFGGLCQGIMFGMMIVGMIITSKYADKIITYKMNLKKSILGDK